ncbi:hypothetical protein SCALM49S_09632 [Streptomyces californicus]
MDPEFTAALRAGTEPAAAAALIRGEEPAEPAAEQEPEHAEPGRARGRPPPSPAADACVHGRCRLLSTGIAHTYMAAESLAAAGRDQGVEITVEAQGSAGFTKLNQVIATATIMWDGNWRSARRAASGASRWWTSG